ncbi:MAG TPA: cation:proton antiporter [Methylomirabilota bacterium]|nr:cation:proton antiporter [Methylomirabilota bacterium]
MTPDPAFFLDLAIVFAAAVLGGAIAWLARQPLILGYVFGGLMIGPFTPGPVVSDLHTFELFAEIGVILLMFSIGIEFSLSDLLRVKWVAILGGPLGILLSTALGVGTAAVMGWPLLTGAVIGIVVSVASTMVLARLLIDQGELHSRHGRVMIGITLVEDLAVVVLTVLLPQLGALDGGRLLAIADALGRAALVLVPFAYLAAKVVPRLMTRVARTQNDELFLIVALMIGLGTAAVTQAVGLSLALGAFLGGLLVANSDYSHEALARLLPLRDVFVALFFVTVGALVDPRTVLDNLPLLGVMLALILVGKLIIWTAVVRSFGYALSTAVLVGAGLTQIGEFSYILVQVARDAGLVGADVYNTTLAASLLTILINAPVVRHAPRWLTALGFLEGGWKRPPVPDVDPARTGHVLLCGFGRVGSAVGEALATFGLRYAVIERDPDVVKGLVARGVPALYGDAGRRDVLEWAGARDASLIIVALPDFEHARLATRAVRMLNAEAPLLVRAHGRAESDALLRDGASEVIQPELEAAGTLIRHALARLQLPKSLALDYLERFRDAMESGKGTAVPSPAMPEVREVAVASDGVADQSLRESRIRERFGVTVVAVVKAGDVILNPPPDTVLRPGDRVRLFGLPAEIERFVRETSVAPDG